MILYDTSYTTFKYYINDYNVDALIEYLQISHERFRRSGTLATVWDLWLPFSDLCFPVALQCLLMYTFAIAMPLSGVLPPI